MVFKYSEVKNKNVINIADGKNLGKITDFAFSYPDGEIKCVFVSEKKFLSGSGGYEMNLCCIKKIGDDAVLVNLGQENQEKQAQEDDVKE